MYFSALLYGNVDPEDKSNCGGAIISENIILTAAHCVDETDPKLKELDRVRVGHSDQFSPEIKSATIEKKMIHSGYGRNKEFKYFINDIALLKLSQPLKFDETLAPICLPSADTITKDDLTLAGWGLTEGGNIKSRPQILQVVGLNHVTLDDCNAEFKDLTKKPNFEFWDRVVCASGKKGKTDGCQGDSGGPLIQPIDNDDEENKIHEAVGVVSFGVGRECVSTVSSVYTRVSKYLDWIEDFVYENRP